jgi:protein SCO1
MTGGAVMTFLRRALIASLFLLSAASGLAAKSDPETVSPATPLAPVALTDHRGAAFTNDRFTGKWSLILLGFTQCPDICPFTLQNLTQVVEQLSMRVSPERLPQVIFVGVDPERDRPVLAEYVAAFSPDFVGISGEWANISTLVESLGGFVRIADKTPGSDRYQVFHSASVAVIDPQGRLAARINPPMEPAATAIFLTGLMRQYGRETN